MRRVIATLVLGLGVLGCGLIREPAPSGVSIELDHFGPTCPDKPNWVEGSLAADVSVLDPILGGTTLAVTAIKIRRLDPGLQTEPDPSGFRVPVVPVTWPADYTGVRMASGQVAVFDATGNLVAMTGREYRVTGAVTKVAAIGGELFGKPAWLSAVTVCRRTGSVVPQ